MDLRIQRLNDKDELNKSLFQGITCVVFAGFMDKKIK